MTVDKAMKEVMQAIYSIYEGDEAKNIAELIVGYVTQQSRIETILKKNNELSSDQTEFIFHSIERLKNHEPVQYITHEAWFAGMRFYVDESVLIPRPETEELVDWVLQDIRGQKLDVRILDVGTGSGCIAIALKNMLPKAELWACDISDGALNIARMNADAVKATIDFIGLDFLDTSQRRQLPRVDVVVSNPPYVPQKDRMQMRENVADHEPSIALFVADNDPLVFYQAIAEFGKEKLNAGGKIYVEMHEDFASEVKRLFLSKGYKLIDIKKDLQGKDRMIRVSLG